MKRLQLATLSALAALALSASAMAEQNNLDFKIVNATGYDINAVYVSGSSEDTWSDDVMGQDLLEDGYEVEITFTGDTSECKSDLKVDWTDDSPSVVWQGIDLCTVSEVTLKYDRNTDVTTAEVK
ncbi:MAG: hypothetical protein NWR47_08980 [Aestuariivirgaceae bacterium]|nr:hypothetical protein [Aestuariivirgaceae bacterium]